ncbi:MAG: hypothetical protein R3A11_08575 [Bdellovibrionota bacterium]
MKNYVMMVMVVAVGFSTPCFAQQGLGMILPTDSYPALAWNDPYIDQDDTEPYVLDLSKTDFVLQSGKKSAYGASYVFVRKSENTVQRVNVVVKFDSRENFSSKVNEEPIAEITVDGIVTIEYDVQISCNAASFERFLNTKRTHISNERMKDF